MWFVRRLTLLEYGYIIFNLYETASTKGIKLKKQVVYAARYRRHRGTYSSDGGSKCIYHGSVSEVSHRQNRIAPKENKSKSLQQISG